MPTDRGWPPSPPGRPAQPVPAETRVAHAYGRGGWYTAIQRTWAWGEPGACSLCPICSINSRGVCTVIVDAYVHAERAPLFDVHGLEDVEGDEDVQELLVPSRARRCGARRWGRTVLHRPRPRPRRRRPRPGGPAED